jgi:hypothetical protein
MFLHLNASFHSNPFCHFRKRGYAKYSSQFKLKRNQKKRFFIEHLQDQDVSLAFVLIPVDVQPTPEQQQTKMDIN